MRHGLLALALMGGALCVAGCEQQAAKHGAQAVDDSPVLGTWALESAGGTTLADQGTPRLAFLPHGRGYFERQAHGSAEPERYDLTYSLSENMISIHSEGEAQDLPRLVGKVTIGEQGDTLRITTHADEQWLLVRAETGNAAEPNQKQNQAADEVQRVSFLLDACTQYLATQGRKPERVMDLVNAGLVSADQLTRPGIAPLPGGFSQMNQWEQAAWLKYNAGYVFFFDYAGTDQASSVVVATLPGEAEGDVVVGMADGTVYIKGKPEVEMLLDLQLGRLPDRWPGDAQAGGIASGLDGSAQ